MNHEELRASLRSDPGEERDGYCPQCDKQTMQILELLNPDDPNGFAAWQCCECGELVEVE